MEFLETNNRWTRPVAVILALLVIALVMRSPQHAPIVTAPPDALRELSAPPTLRGQFEIRPAPSAAPAALEGHQAVVGDGPLLLYTTEGSYTPDQVRGLAQPLSEALSYVSQRTDMQLVAPVTIVFDSHAGGCALDGAAYTEKRTIVLYACPQIPTRRAVNILAHEFVHQLASDHYGPAHLKADLVLSEGLATWGAGKYWLGRESDFRGFVLRNYATSLLPLGSHYRDFGTLDAMNRLYYQWASLVDFLIVTHGREAFDTLYKSGQGMQPNTADYSGVLGADLAGVEEQWKEWLRQ
ncbi:MAG TPA: hypothetical protein VFZ66_20670 [Herpetosiphonaceae bacterium]